MFITLLEVVVIDQNNRIQSNRHLCLCQLLQELEPKHLKKSVLLYINQNLT